MAGNSKNMQVLRLSIVGFGTVGRWLADAIGHHRSWFEAEHGVTVTVVGVANRRDGFVYRDAGFDTTTLLEFVSARRSLRDYPGGRRWDTALEGLAQTECDVMAEASSTNPREPEPALSHIRQALGRGTHVITSSKAACEALFTQMLKQTEDVDVPLKVLLAAGQADLDRNLKALHETCDQYLPKKPIRACIDKMNASKPKDGTVRAAAAQLDELE